MRKRPGMRSDRWCRPSRYRCNESECSRSPPQCRRRWRCSGPYRHPQPTKRALSTSTSPISLWRFPCQWRSGRSGGQRLRGGRRGPRRRQPDPERRAARQPATRGSEPLDRRGDYQWRGRTDQSGRPRQCQPLPARPGGAGLGGCAHRYSGQRLRVNASVLAVARQNGTATCIAQTTSNGLTNAIVRAINR